MLAGDKGSATLHADGSYVITSGQGTETGGATGPQSALSRQWQAFASGEPGPGLDDLEPTLALIESAYAAALPQGLALRGLPRYWRPRVSAPPLAPQHGQIVASPEQGPDILVTVYQDGGQLIADWGDTSPFHYDRFNIRWDRDGSNAGQVTQDGASSGHWLILDDTHATDPVRSEPAT